MLYLYLANTRWDKLQSIRIVYCLLLALNICSARKFRNFHYTRNVCYRLHTYAIITFAHLIYAQNEKYGQ